MYPVTWTAPKRPEPRELAAAEAAIAALRGRIAHLERDLAALARENTALTETIQALGARDERTNGVLLAKLTIREQSVMDKMQGCPPNKDIAYELGISEQMVKNYLRTIYDKTGTHNRHELALFLLHSPQLREAIRAKLDTSTDRRIRAHRAGRETA